MIAALSLCLLGTVIPSNESVLKSEEVSSRMESLFHAAEEEFGPLGEKHPLRTLIDGVCKGTPAEISPRKGEQVGLALPDSNWNQDHVLEAKHIQWLCSTPRAIPAITHRGVFLVGARIRGTIDLSFASLSFPLALVNCSIPDGIILHQAHIKTLLLSGSHIGASKSTGHSISAHGARIEGNVLLAKGFTSNGQVHFDGANIGGVVDIGNATISNPDGIAISCQSANVAGSFLVYEGSKIRGEVNISHAKLGDRLLIKASQLANPGGRALGASGTTISGEVDVSKGTSIQGEVDLRSSRIGSNVGFSGTKIENQEGKTINLQLARVGGAVFLVDQFTSRGQISLAGASIASNFECLGSDLRNPDGLTLFSDGATFGGSVNLSNTKSIGTISLVSAVFSAM